MDIYTHNVAAHTTLAQIVPENKGEVTFATNDNTLVEYVLISCVIAIIVGMALMWRRHHRRLRRYKVR